MGYRGAPHEIFKWRELCEIVAACVEFLKFVDSFITSILYSFDQRRTNHKLELSVSVLLNSPSYGNKPALSPYLVMGYLI